jgi:hypothetical protein
MTKPPVDESPEYDERRAADKRRELARVVRRGLASGGVRDRRSTDAIMAQFVVITPPELPPVSFDFADVTAEGGKSIKPGNVVFNLRKVMVAVAEGAVGIAGATMPWVVVVSVLLALNSLHEAMEVEIGQTEALVLAAMWKRRDARNMVRRANVPTLVNEELAAAKGKRRSLSRPDIELALKRLQDLRCVAAADGGRIRLRERVRVTYD